MTRINRLVIASLAGILMIPLLAQGATNLTQRQLWNQWHDAIPAYTNTDKNLPPAVDAETAHWTDRVIPLPKEASVKGAVTVKAGTIGWQTTLKPGCLELATITNLLNSWAMSTGDAGTVNITIIQLDGNNTGLSRDLVKKLQGLANADQAYAIVTQTGPQGRMNITVAANTSLGALYGVRTLTDIIRPSPTTSPDTPIEIPMLQVLDWPDLGERGQWGCEGTDDLEWYGRWKMNMMEEIVRLDFRPDRLVVTAGQQTSLLERATTLGIKIVPLVPHLDCLIDAGLNKAWYDPLYTNWLPVMATQATNQSPPLRDRCAGLCMSHPMTVALLADAFRQIAAQIEPYHRDAMIWTSEMDTRCWCVQCKDKPQSELELAAILKAYFQAREQYPWLRMRVLLSQATFAVNDKLIAMTPADMGLSYYNGSLSYRSDRKPLIYPLLEQYARSGRWLGVYPQVTPCWYTIFPWTAPQFVRYRMGEFVAKKLSSVSVYSVPNKNYYEFNIMATAEWSWNARGRTPAEFARAYATVRQLSQTNLFAQWALKAGDAGWTLAESGFGWRTTYDPPLGFLGKIKVTDFRWGHAENSAIDKSAQSLSNAQEALRLAQAINDRSLLDESEATLASLEAMGFLTELSEMVTSGLTNDTAKTRFSRCLDEMDRCAHIVRSRVFDWSDRIEAGKSKKGMQPPRVNHTAVGLLRTCDTLRTLAARFGIPDPRPASRLTNLIECAKSDFTNNAASATASTFSVDVTDRISKAGGSYQITVDNGGRVLTIEAVFQNAAGNRRVVARSPENNERGMHGEKYYECRIVFPPVPKDERVFVDITLRPLPLSQPKEFKCSRLGLRQVWDIGQSPWETRAGADKGRNK